MQVWRMTLLKALRTVDCTAPRKKARKKFNDIQNKLCPSQRGARSRLLAGIHRPQRAHFPRWGK